MEINKELNGNKLNIALVGRLDAVTASDLDKVIQNELTGIEELTMDFSGLDFVASAGLRVLLVAQKRMNKQGTILRTNKKEKPCPQIIHTRIIALTSVVTGDIPRLTRLP